MKIKQSHSDLDERKYIDRMLFLTGMFAAGAGLAQAWPALSHIAVRMVG